MVELQLEGDKVVDLNFTTFVMGSLCLMASFFLQSFSFFFLSLFSLLLQWKLSGFRHLCWLLLDGRLDIPFLHVQISKWLQVITLMGSGFSHNFGLPKGFKLSSSRYNRLVWYFTHFFFLLLACRTLFKTNILYHSYWTFQVSSWCTFLVRAKAASSFITRNHHAKYLFHWS